MTWNHAPAIARSFALVMIALLSLGKTGWAQDAAMALPVDPQPLVVQTDAGERAFSIEIADDPQERSRGLMYRESLPDDRGMLFVFESTQRVGFWMKNTPLPLDLVFIGQDGIVRDILPGAPFSEASIALGDPVRFVLELKAGTAEKAGIETGDSVHHPAVNQAAGAGNAG